MVPNASSAAPPVRATSSQAPSPAQAPQEAGALTSTMPPRASQDTGETCRTDVDVDPGVLIVDWDGPDDPENPRNWSFKKRWAATIVVPSFSFVSPVTSSIIAPASEQLAEEFGITSQTVIAMVTSIFVLAYAMGPLLLGPLSELFGRSRVVQLANLWYIAWNLGCGFARTQSQILAFRFLSGFGGGAALAIGGGVLGDCWKPHERGQAVALYSLAPVLGPVMGPICGAWIAQKSTWRWVFWSTTILSAIVGCGGFLMLRETYAPVLLERKARRIRKNMGSEKSQHQEIRTVYDHGDRHWKQIYSRALFRPFKLFFKEPIIMLLGIYMAFVYGTLYLFLTTIDSIFEDVYRESIGIAGLNYIALGIGLTGASQINARVLDRLYSYMVKKNGGEGKPEYRLPSMVPGTLLLPIGLLITGWTAQAHTHWIGPDIGIFLVGAGTMLNFQCIQTYVIDAFTLYAASALAAVTFLRSCAGFAFPLFAPDMFAALGYGKGDTIIAVVAIVVGCPAPFLFMAFGERIRAASQYSNP